jgi:pyridoxal phosphate enzyme (YggS family)
MGIISYNVKKLLKETPSDITIVAAVKGRTVEEVQEAIESSIKYIGENYLQEAEKKYPLIRKVVRWHFIGHIQKRKSKKIVELFDMIETLDSIEVAEEINREASKIDKIMPVLIEVNSGREPQKSGLMPENVESFIEKVSCFRNIKIRGLMTMGPFFEDAEKLRPYFVETRKLFEDIKKKNIQNVEMEFLSMGMSSSYKVAIEEGANIIRIGTLIFGPRS